MQHRSTAGLEPWKMTMQNRAKHLKKKVKYEEWFDSQFPLILGHMSRQATEPPKPTSPAHKDYYEKCSMFVLYKTELIEISCKPPDHLLHPLI